MAEHRWEAELECIDVGELSNVVVAAHWRLTSTDGPCVRERWGEARLAPPDPDHFVEIPGEMTPEARIALVRAWVIATDPAGAGAAEARNEADLAADAIAPPVTLLAVGAGPDAPPNDA